MLEKLCLQKTIKNRNTTPPYTSLNSKNHPGPRTWIIYRPCELMDALKALFVIVQECFIPLWLSERARRVLVSAGHCGSAYRCSWHVSYAFKLQGRGDLRDSPGSWSGSRRHNAGYGTSSTSLTDLNKITPASHSSVLRRLVCFSP